MMLVCYNVWYQNNLIQIPQQWKKQEFQLLLHFYCIHGQFKEKVQQSRTNIISYQVNNILNLTWYVEQEKIQKKLFSLKVVAGPLNQLECVSCKENFKGKGIHHYYKCKAKKVKLFIVENVS